MAKREPMAQVQETRGSQGTPFTPPLPQGSFAETPDNLGGPFPKDPPNTFSEDSGTASGPSPVGSLPEVGAWGRCEGWGSLPRS